MIIGISGKIGAGKDTVAGIIRELGGVSKNSVDWQIMKFAGKLKERIAVTWGINVYTLEDQHTKTKLSPLGITWRELMQKEGEKMREIDEDYWVKALMSHYEERYVQCIPNLKHTWGGDKFIIPDTEEVPENLRGRFSACELFCWSSPKEWLITDLRYPNEAKAIKDKGGILLRVNSFRSGFTTTKEGEFTFHIKSNPFFDAQPHHSETALDDYQDWEYVIENNGTIEELTEQVKQFLIKFNLI